jgi:hypothetical protein
MLLIDVIVFKGQKKIIICININIIFNIKLQVKHLFGI